MADQNARGHSPAAETTTPDPGDERFHMWAPRPLLRSILWTPRGPESDNAAMYDVFITQSALASLLDHLRSAPEDERPFGLLAGDLCEDPDGESRYVLIREVCRSRVSLTGEDGDQIPATAWEALRIDAEGRKGSLVGWYLRHEADQLTLTDSEVATHAKYFNEPWQGSSAALQPDSQARPRCRSTRWWRPTHWAARSD